MDADACGALLDLKLALIDTPTSSDALAHVAAYLALVIRRARSWFLENQAEGYSRYRLRWALNLGIPSAGYDDSDVRRRFDAAAQAAWALSTTDGSVTVESARCAAEQALGQKGGSNDQIALIPEVAAEVVTYARSPLRSPGLHVMVDVGASTLDVCSFVLHELEGEDQYAMLTAQVQRLGALMLHWYRLERLGKDRVAPGVAEIPLQSVGASVPEHLLDYVAGHPPATLRSIDQEFADRCVSVLMATLMDLKKRRDPHSPRWKEGLPVFLCGGGSRMRFFQQILDAANERLCAATLAKGLSRRRLPVPQNLVTQDLPAEDFDRVAVAFGLSHGALDIGETVPPTDIEDIPQLRVRNFWENYISKDQV